MEPFAYQVEMAARKQEAAEWLRGIGKDYFPLIQQLIVECRSQYLPFLNQNRAVFTASGIVLPELPSAALLWQFLDAAFIVLDNGGPDKYLEPEQINPCGNGGEAA